MTDQPSLFPLAPELGSQPAGTSLNAELEARRARFSAVAARLPATLRMGTSSWSFPGWQGIVYPSAMTTRELARVGLREYARHPILRTVGIDRSYYAAIPEEDLRRYADQLPDGFLCCAKAPVTVTSFTVPAPGGAIEPNPGFLSADTFVDEMLAPFSRSFAAHTGPILFQFPPVPPRAALEPTAFAEMLDHFLAALPDEFEYAVELREHTLLTPEYARVVARHGVPHVASYWSGMPMPAEQAALTASDADPFTMVRLLLRPFTKYEQRRQEMMPFNRIVQPDERMRREVTTLLARANAAARRAFLLVNNKAEGSAPLTIEAIAARLAELADADEKPGAAAPAGPG
jgi:uncharacterized protein YecE (DUF72 family)